MKKNMSSLPATFLDGFHDVELCRRMDYRNLGTTGLMILKLALGGGTLSEFYGYTCLARVCSNKRRYCQSHILAHVSDLDVDEANRTIIRALQTGINYIDTAPYYGQGRSEEILGRALKAVPRETYYIATKVGRYGDMFDFSAKRTRESVMKSLALLGVDYVDIIQIHDIEFAENLDIIISECLPALEEIVKEGKAKYIGVTGYPLECLKKCIEMAPGRFDVVLSYARYTLLDDSLKSYIDFFHQHKLGIICASSHALGLLTNDGPQPWHPADDEQKQLCRKAPSICKASDVELGKLAMDHSMQLQGATTFLTGMQTRNLLAINLSCLHDGLTEKEQEVLQHLRETLFNKSRNWEGIELKLYRAKVNKTQ